MLAQRYIILFNAQEFCCINCKMLCKKCIVVSMCVIITLILSYIVYPEFSVKNDK